MYFIEFIFLFWIKLNIEKCSESMGMNSQWYFFTSLIINFHPQIILSLFAIKIFLENFIILIVGIRPAIPEIAATVTSNLIFFNELSLWIPKINSKLIRLNQRENKSNKDLLIVADELNEEFEKTKELIIDLTRHLDGVESLYNKVNKEIEKRYTGKWK